MSAYMADFPAGLVSVLRNARLPAGADDPVNSVVHIHDDAVRSRATESVTFIRRKNGSATA